VLDVVRTVQTAVAVPCPSTTTLGDSSDASGEGAATTCGALQPPDAVETAAANTASAAPERVNTVRAYASLVTKP
jgi:hypothetical protein